ncbi:iron chelate uptake ABC transporter family permease subunit [Thermoleophilia bacterium SCSIO 60948]|nr:iron chelate uptake ABC transporter family permease subunit [Thermoleophilia bacterium SCSIO 60948]
MERVAPAGVRSGRPLPPRPVAAPEEPAAEAARRRRSRESTAAGLLRGATGRSAGLVAALVLLGLAGALSLALGAASIPIGDTIDAIFGRGVGDGLIVETERVPRTLIGIAVGAGLGAAGALIQGLTRNPLADPWILGIEAGAALAVVVGIFLVSADGGALAWYALAGAGITWAFVYAIGSSGGGKATPLNLTLAGAATAALLAALTSAIVVFDAETLDEYRFWIAGSIAGRELSVLVDMLPFLAAGAVVALVSGRALNGLSLGHDVARALGQRVALTQVAVAVGVVLLSGAAVAMAGPIGFVGLTVPHLARMLIGPDYRWIIPYSAVLGATLLLVADLVGRLIDPPQEIQVGIVMAVVGAPVFIALVRRRRLAAI